MIFNDHTYIRIYKLSINLIKLRFEKTPKMYGVFKGVFCSTLTPVRVYSIPAPAKCTHYKIN